MLSNDIEINGNKKDPIDADLEVRDRGNEQYQALSTHDKALCELAKNPRWLMERLVDFSEAFTDKEVKMLDGYFVIGHQGKISEILLNVLNRVIKEQF